MTSAITFDTTSPRFTLPFLFSGQSQREFYVNEALSILDAVLHCAVEGTLSAPPTASSNGQNWLVGTGATGDWAGADGKLACQQNGGWIFITPQNGMHVLNRTTGQTLLYRNGWQSPAAISNPTGGTTVDSQARDAIGQILSALRQSGILPAA